MRGLRVGSDSHKAEIGVLGAASDFLGAARHVRVSVGVRERTGPQMWHSSTFHSVLAGYSLHVDLCSATHWAVMQVNFSLLKRKEFVSLKFLNQALSWFKRTRILESLCFSLSQSMEVCSENQ